jgi:hypothetical protein
MGKEAKGCVKECPLGYLPEIYSIYLLNPELFTLKDF